MPLYNIQIYRYPLFLITQNHLAFLTKYNISYKVYICIYLLLLLKIPHASVTASNTFPPILDSGIGPSDPES